MLYSRRGEKTAKFNKEETERLQADAALQQQQQQ